LAPKSNSIRFSRYINTRKSYDRILAANFGRKAFKIYDIPRNLSNKWYHWRIGVSKTNWIFSHHAAMKTCQLDQFPGTTEPHFIADHCVSKLRLRVSWTEAHFIYQINVSVSYFWTNTTSSLGPPTRYVVMEQSWQCTLYAGALLCAIVWLIRRPSRYPPLPPGPKRLPVIGSLLDMPPSYQWITFDKWCKQYGMFEMCCLTPMAELHHRWHRVHWDSWD